MPHLEILTKLVLRLSIAVVCIDLSFVVYVLYRRVARNRFYRRKDAAAELLAAPVAQIVSGELGIAEARPALLAFAAPAERAALEELLLRGITPENHDRVSQLLVEAGYVESWARTAFGRTRARQLVREQTQSRRPETVSGRRTDWAWLRRTRVLAVRRAVAVSHLRRLSPSVATPFLIEALRDPSPLPRRTAIAGLGRHRAPAAFPLLLLELRNSVAETNDVSLRVVKTALTRFSAGDLARFVPLLEDTNPRVRYFAIDIVREICASDPEQGRLFASAHMAVLEKLTSDISRDVRARTAGVIGLLPAPAAVPVLRRLLEDTNEFVRLHATRACADPSFAVLSDDLLRRLRDSRWRVREAAVRSLAAMGDAGVSRLVAQFLSTPDRYSSEQLSEYMQRSGALDGIVRQLADVDGGNADAVCRKLIALGHRATLTHYANNGVGEDVRVRLNALLAPAAASKMPPQAAPASRVSGAVTGGN